MQSVVPAKVVQAVSTDGNKVSAVVLIYDDEDESGPIYIHEIILEEMISEDEGNKISAMLYEEFPDQDPFTFEASIEI